MLGHSPARSVIDTRPEQPNGCTNGVRAIPTRYAGCHFRSRLEARWAVFFDALGIEWEYEPEGFETSAGRYLPDFLLRLDASTYIEHDCVITEPTWFEVKPPDAPVDPRHVALVAASGMPLVVAAGMPRTWETQWSSGRLLRFEPPTYFVPCPAEGPRPVGFFQHLPRCTRSDLYVLDWDDDCECERTIDYRSESVNRINAAYTAARSSERFGT